MNYTTNQKPARRFAVISLMLGLLLLLTACGGTDSSQTINPPEEISDHDLASEFVRLLQAKDTEGLDQFLSPEFIIQRADGTYLSKEEYLANYVTIEEFNITGAVGKQTGNVRAIRYDLEAIEFIDGKQITTDPVPRLSVFVWNGERWQLFAHSNFVPPDK